MPKIIWLTTVILFLCSCTTQGQKSYNEPILDTLYSSEFGAYDDYHLMVQITDSILSVNNT